MSSISLVPTGSSTSASTSSWTVFSTSTPLTQPSTPWVSPTTPQPLQPPPSSSTLRLVPVPQISRPSDQASERRPPLAPAIPSPVPRAGSPATSPRCLPSPRSAYPPTPPTLVTTPLRPSKVLSTSLVEPVVRLHTTSLSPLTSQRSQI